MANNYDSIAFTQRVVYGMDTDTGLATSNDYNDHIRPLGSQPTGFEFDMLDYLTNGGGRYAIPAIFPIIDEFFQSSSITPGIYTGDPLNNSGIPSIYTELRIGDDEATSDVNEFEAATRASIWQYGTDVTSDDFAERAYIFGTTGFELDITNAEFIVNDDGSRSVSGMRVKADDDNFDFVGGSFINPVANFFLLPAYDPYELIREEVPIEYTTSTQGREYFYNDDIYVNDNIKEALFVSVQGTNSGLAKLAAGLGVLLQDIKGSATRSSEYLRNIDANPFFKYERGNSKVIYGTPGNDDIGVFRDIDIEFYNDNPIRVASGFDVPNSPNLTNLLMVGGSGNDTITSYNVGDELLGGDGSDVLEGRGGEDTLDGGEFGADLAVFSDNFENYQYSLATDGTITFDHTEGTQADGKDTLKNMEFARFGDGRTVALPLEDGPEETKTVEFLDTDEEPFANVSLTMPTYMLDRDADYMVNISALPPSSTYNIALVIDTSSSMDGGPDHPPNTPTPLKQAQDAYVDLIDYFIDNGIAENARFSVIPFNSGATLFRDLSPEAAKATIQSFIPEGMTNINAALEETFQALIRPPFKQQRIGYFLSDGRSFRPLDTTLISQLQRNANIQAFGFGNEVDQNQLDAIDSDKAVILSDASELSTEFFKTTITVMI